MRQYRATYSDGMVHEFYAGLCPVAVCKALEYTAGTAITLVSLERIFEEEET